MNVGSSIALNSLVQGQYSSSVHGDEKARRVNNFSAHLPEMQDSSDGN